MLDNKDHAFEIDDDVELFNNSFAENHIDASLILLKELILINRFNDIVEIWELICIDTASFIITKFVTLLIFCWLLPYSSLF